MIVYLDMTVALICIIAGVVVLSRKLFVFCSVRKSPTWASVFVLIGVMAWSIYLTLALATITDIGIKPDWQVKHGYALARSFMMFPWFYLLYNICRGTHK